MLRTISAVFVAAALIAAPALAASDVKSEAPRAAATAKSDAGAVTPAKAKTMKAATKKVRHVNRHRVRHHAYKTSHKLLKRHHAATQASVKPVSPPAAR